MGLQRQYAEKHPEKFSYPFHGLYQQRQSYGFIENVWILERERKSFTSGSFTYYLSTLGGLVS